MVVIILLLTMGMLSLSFMTPMTLMIFMEYLTLYLVFYYLLSLPMTAVGVIMLTFVLVFEGVLFACLVMTSSTSSLEG
uniref:NADH dehydrogenase subunit 4L n=1 Tax=Thetys vagina TaxID=942565 RepID=A0AA86M3V4_9UROC|nr:NADH dehydrogenase subunit 4L [Thetys vagina]